MVHASFLAVHPLSAKKCRLLNTNLVAPVVMDDLLEDQPPGAPRRAWRYLSVFVVAAAET